MNVIDLTHELNQDMSLFPGAQVYTLEQTATIENDYYVEHKMTLTTHLGTHMDSPSHIIAGGKRLCDYPASAFVGKGLVIDVSHIKGTITKSVLLSYDKIESMEFLLFYTGHDTYYGTQRYLDTFPVLDESSCGFLKELAARNLKGVGIDTLSIDPVEPVSIDRHKVLLGVDLLIIENLAHLKELVNQTFDLIALPLKMDKIEGSPVRAIALVR